MQFVVNWIRIETPAARNADYFAPVLLSRPRHDTPIRLHVFVAATPPDGAVRNPRRGDVPASRAG
ncbi:hypothetical protein LGM41_26300 [Burkholderia seminalis]|nr:hypothetical protein [Burkholderia seminalis]MCA8043240.1 hypothetical protein [Burkholderia seminalis]